MGWDQALREPHPNPAPKTLHSTLTNINSTLGNNSIRNYNKWHLVTRNSISNILPDFTHMHAYTHPTYISDVTLTYRCHTDVTLTSMSDSVLICTSLSVVSFAALTASAFRFCRRTNVAWIASLWRDLFCFIILNASDLFVLFTSKMV